MLAVGRKEDGRRPGFRPFRKRRYCHFQRAYIAPSPFRVEGRRPVNLEKEEGHDGTHQNRADSRRYRDRNSARRKRSRAKRNDQFAAIAHSMTLVAWTIIELGILIASAFAVRILITTSNLLGNSIGRFFGLAPLRILSTK